MAEAYAGVDGRAYIRGFHIQLTRAAGSKDSTIFELFFLPSR